MARQIAGQGSRGLRRCVMWFVRDQPECLAANTAKQLHGRYETTRGSSENAEIHTLNLQHLGCQVAAKWQQFVAIVAARFAGAVGALRWGTLSVIASRAAALLVAGFAGVAALQLSRASAQWWHRAPADFEECAEAANKSPTPQEKTAALAQCSSKFAGRRKPGGGYTYYDFMQDRSFDIAGPNPTPEEQKYIDGQYALYLEKQRRNNIAAAFAKQQQLQLEQASLRGETTSKIPMPHERPKVLQQQQAGERSRARGGSNCPHHTFSCEWPRLSETVHDLKRLFSPSSGKKKG